MATQEKDKNKQKKKGGFLSNFYRSTSKTHHKPKPEPPPSTTPKPVPQHNNNNNNDNNALIGSPKIAISPNLVRRKPKSNGQEIAQCGGGKIRAVAAAGVEVGRKSVSHADTNLSSVMGLLQVKVLVSDMPGFMQAHAFRCARTTYDSSDNFSPKHMAYNLKKEFDKVYGPAWHCIVGSSFGSFVTHSTGCFLYFSIENLYVLVFKTKVQRARD